MAASLAIAVQKAVASDDDFTFEVEVLDENHVKVSDLPKFRIESNSDYDNGDLNYFLNKGNIRAVMEDGVEVSKWDENDGQEVWDKICAKGKYIVIKLYHSSAKYAEYKKGGSTVESSDDVVSDDVASADFDEWLDSYEEFCTEYIELLKKHRRVTWMLCLNIRICYRKHRSLEKRCKMLKVKLHQNSGLSILKYKRS